MIEKKFADNSIEKQRLQELYQYNILNTLPEKEYQEIATLASLICDVPIALISFIDEDKQWFKSSHGIEITQTERDISFCTHTIDQDDEILIVEDSREDDRFKHNPLVTGDPNIVFYAGAPLISENGYSLGTVCVLDTKKKTLSPEQQDGLKILSSRVMRMLELRKSNHQLEMMRVEMELRNKDLEQFAMVVAHDIKSPLSSVLISTELLQADFDISDQEKTKLLQIISHSGKKIKTLVDGILSYSRGATDLNNKEQIDIKQFIEQLKDIISSPKPYVIELPETDMRLRFNKTQLEQILINLISNSIRYNENLVAKIEIEFSENDTEYVFSFSDNGIGIPEDKHESVFELFTTLKANDSYGVAGSGIGLATVKKIIESVGGTIKLHSTPGNGAQFIFTLAKQ